MPLSQLTFTPQKNHNTPSITDFLKEAEKRTDQFFANGLDRRYPRYLPSNPQNVIAAITALKDSGLLRGDNFCEWGSGLGIATCLASLAGFHAVGIELELGLVDLSTQLAHDLHIPAHFLCTSYLPEGYEEVEGIGGKDLLTPQATATGGSSIDISPIYDGLDPAEIDLFFVYPWPGQEEFMMDLFQEVATEDSILLIHHADASTTAYRQDL